jgi:putative SbcD/Mre11-related phosphoesterase
MKFIYDAPALLYKKALILGDTHFGMEQKLRRKGIYDSQFSTRLFEKLEGLVKKHKASRVIFLGDVKEDITMLDDNTRKILGRLGDLCDIMIVRGNHDGGIEQFLNAQIIPAEGFVYEKLGLLHGHSWPADELMQCEYLVMGHQHPLISFKDSMGKKHSEPVWIVADADAEKIAERYKKFNKKIKLILMPAFNPLVGFPINFSKKEQLGPLLNNKLFKLEHALLFRLDGTCLGRLNNINFDKSGAHGKEKKRT